MSDATKYIDVDDEQYEDAPKALRDAYKALHKAHEKAVTERDGARTQLASKAISDVLDDKGFKNPKRVERDLLADGIDPLDNSAVETWLTTNGEDYARSETPPSEELPPEQTPEQLALQKGYESLAGGDELRTPADMSKFDLAKAEITPDMTGAQVLEVYRKHKL